MRQGTAKGDWPIKRLVNQLVTGLGLFVLLWGTVSCASATGESIAASEAGLSTAVFAGGCFWCMEQPFDALPGVVETTSGYTGGTVENPTYQEVSSGNTGHIEAMEVRYDAEQVDYETLLDTFWHNIDPLDDSGQFCDKGSQYRSAIFYDTPEQREAAEASREAIAQTLSSTLGRSEIATEILPAAPFYDAEDYHQNYYQTNPIRYKVYRFGCGRDRRLAEVWGDDAPAHD